MPNWVYNSLTIHDTMDNLKKISENLSKSYKTYYSDNPKNEIKEEIYESKFSFWNVIKPDDKILNKYFTTCDSIGMADPNNWYHWNVNNWGCKWDAGSVEVDLNEKDKCLYYHFDTAWNPPIPVIKELAKQYPTASISFGYEEETGWGGEMDFEKGELVHEEEYEADPDFYEEEDEIPQGN